MSLLAQSVTRGDDGWDFQCPGVVGDRCHTTEGAAYSSTGWPTLEVATARGRQHFDSHAYGTPTPSLDEFRAEHGLIPSDDGKTAYRPEDLA